MNKLEEIIKNANIKFENDEAKKAFIDSINKDYVNGITTKDQKEFEEQKKSLQDKIKTLGDEAEASKKTIKELQNSLTKSNKEKDIALDRNTAIKLAGKELTEEQFENLMLLTNNKLSKDDKLVKEDVMKDILENSGFISKKDENPAGTKIPAGKKHRDDEFGKKDDGDKDPQSLEDQFAFFMKHGGR